MIQELLYTSHEGKGLRPGSGGGYCTVLSSEGMSTNLASILEKLSGYKHPFDAHDSRSLKNPVLFRHAVVPLGGVHYHVLSRVSDLRREHTGRTNKLAHHIVISPNELPPAGPTAMFQSSDLFRTDWDKRVAVVPSIPVSRIPQGEWPVRICRTWAALAGDAGWGGHVAQLLLEAGSPVVHVVFPLGADTLALCDEVFRLLPPTRRWATTFSTYCGGQSPVPTQLRFLLSDTPDADRLRRDYRQKVIDLAQSLPAPPPSPLVIAARTGVLPRSPELARSIELPQPSSVDELASDVPASDDDRPIADSGSSFWTRDLESQAAGIDIRSTKQSGQRSTTLGKSHWMLSWKATALASVAAIFLLMSCVFVFGAVVLFARFRSQPTANLPIGSPAGDKSAGSGSDPAASGRRFDPESGEATPPNNDGNSAPDRGAAIGKPSKTPTTEASGTAPVASTDADSPQAPIQLPNKTDPTIRDDQTTDSGRQPVAGVSETSAARTIPPGSPAEGSSQTDSAASAAEPRELNSVESDQIQWVDCPLEPLPNPLDKRKQREYEAPNLLLLPTAPKTIEFIELAGLDCFGDPPLTAASLPPPATGLQVVKGRATPVATFGLEPGNRLALTWDRSYIKTLVDYPEAPEARVDERVGWCMLFLRADGQEYGVSFRQAYPPPTLALGSPSVLAESDVPEGLYLDQPVWDPASLLHQQQFTHSDPWEEVEGRWTLRLQSILLAAIGASADQQNPPRYQFEVTVWLSVRPPRSIQSSISAWWDSGANQLSELPATLADVDVESAALNLELIRIPAVPARPNGPPLTSEEKDHLEKRARLVERRRLLNELRQRLQALSQVRFIAQVYARFERATGEVVLRPVFGGQPRLIAGNPSSP